MKSIFRYIILSSLALSAVLAACSKDTVVEGGRTEAVEDSGLRTITLSFSSDTKVAFDGTRPEFQAGDVIKVANATQSEDATIQVSDGVASITTSLTGPLTAVFPSSAANVTGSGPLGTPEYIIKDQQDGTVADALIAVAQIEGTRALFKLKSALFEITPPSGATSFTVTSLNTIDSVTGRRSTTANAVAINTTGASDAAKRVITVTGLDTGGKAYVALVPGVNLTDLSFEYTADASHGAMKGIPMKDITAAGKANATVARGKYTIDNNNWHPYVEISGLKWATMNIGATAETGTDSYGKYFAWGDVIGQVFSSSTFTTPFDWVHAPFNNGQPTYDSNYFTSEVRATECPSGILALKNDAAYANWGGAWRMPVQTEFDALIENKEWDSTNKGYIFGASPNRIFIPAAGYGEGTTRENTDIAGNCWSSTLRASQREYAIDLDYLATISFLLTQEHLRCTGRSIRPVADL